MQPLHKMQFMRSLIRIRNLCVFNCRTVAAGLTLLHSLVNYHGHIISLDSFLKALAPHWINFEQERNCREHSDIKPQLRRWVKLGGSEEEEEQQLQN